MLQQICDKNSLNQISLTGVRALALLGLLAIKPRSLEEIRDAFLKHNIISPDQPDDILRIDLNTIKGIGCKVSRADAKTNHKYELLYHPFKMDLSLDDVKLIKRLYDKLKKSSDLSLLMEYDNLLKKFADNVKDENVKEALLGISILRFYDLSKIKKFEVDCMLKNIVRVLYKRPTAKSTDEIVFVAQNIGISNDKLYIYGYDVNKKRQTMLNCSRIVEVISKRRSDETPPDTNVKVKFSLLKNDTDILGENEEILTSSNGESIIEASYFNDFTAVQRILSFGSRCTVKEPEYIKNMVIAKLKEMRSLYEKGR